MKFDNDGDLAFIRDYNWANQEEVRMAVAIVMCPKEHYRESCPAMKVEFCKVSALLASNPSTPAEVLNHMSRYLQRPQVLERVAANSNSDCETLNKLAHHHSPQVRVAVAEGENLDIETLWTLARDDHADVRYTLAESYSAPVEILDELAVDDNPYVAQRAQLTRRRVLSMHAQSTVDDLPRRESRLRRLGLSS